MPLLLDLLLRVMIFSLILLAKCDEIIFYPITPFEGLEDFEDIGKKWDGTRARTAAISLSSRSIV